MERFCEEKGQGLHNISSALPQQCANFVWNGCAAQGYALRLVFLIMPLRTPPPSHHPLAHCSPKLDQARKLIDELCQEFEEITPKYSVKQWNDTVKKRLVFAVEGPPIPHSIPVLVGSVIHQLRSVFDHIAWAFASRAGIDERGIQFPVTLTSKSFDEAAKKCLKGMPQAGIDIAKSIQPWADGDPDHSSLGVLHKLDIDDKHKASLVMAHATRAGNEITFKGHLEEDVTIHLGKNTFFEGVENGSHLCWLNYESKAEQPSLLAENNASVSFVFPRIGKLESMPVIHLLTSLESFTKKRLFLYEKVMDDLVHGGGLALVRA